MVSFEILHLYDSSRKNVAQSIRSRYDYKKIIPIKISVYTKLSDDKQIEVKNNQSINFFSTKQYDPLAPPPFFMILSVLVGT